MRGGNPNGGSAEEGASRNSTCMRVSYCHDDDPTTIVSLLKKERKERRGEMKLMKLCSGVQWRSVVSYWQLLAQSK